MTACQPTSVRSIWSARFMWTLFLVSRPGFYHVTAILYALPAVRDPMVLLSPAGVAGLMFALFPLNLLVYSFNDYKDVDIDRKNPRKGGMHGAQASAEELWACIVISVVAIALLVPLMTADLAFSVKWVVTCILVNWSYNFGPQLSRVPLLDMFPPIGYLGTCVFAAKVMSLEQLDGWVYGFFAVMAMRTQLWLQRMDIVADAAVGKRTTAVFLGKQPAAAGVLGLLALEGYMGYQRGCSACQLFAASSLLVFLLEQYIGKKEVTMALMALSGLPFTIGFMMGESCIIV
eukprot:TRINITY_DN36923_c0_g1_i1.p1 TRINITY_DN36923_c0_g1~~TRINITY_DN36923_c0_g1_i1.p1  ORF type:complete len:289 (+),score=40.31 TRINITY_DN36923_c0_g1_i1:66-932(+)